jgi:hypothetical protein
MMYKSAYLQYSSALVTVSSLSSFLLHQGSISPTFYVQLLHTQVARAAFCAYVLGLYFTGISLPTQKLRVERWWNGSQVADLQLLDRDRSRLYQTFTFTKNLLKPEINYKYFTCWPNCFIFTLPTSGIF